MTVAVLGVAVLGVAVLCIVGVAVLVLHFHLMVARMGPIGLFAWVRLWIL